MAVVACRRWVILLLAAALVQTGGCKASNNRSGPLRLGFFPNITHAQALVGNREGTFARALGSGNLQTLQFIAGPAEMEALASGSLDVAYVGTGPAINFYLKGDRQLRVIAAAANGGAVLVARTATSPQGLKGKTVASPQFGNSQDVALRHWLKTQGLSIANNSKADVTVVPLANADILGLFISGKLEAAWVPEPWGARLIAEGGAHLLLDERDLWPNRKFHATLLVTTKRILEARPAEVRAILRAHLEITQQWAEAPSAFAARANDGFAQLSGRKLSSQVLQDAFSRLQPAVRPIPEVLSLAAKHAQELGLVTSSDVSGMIDTSALEDVLRGASFRLMD